MDITSMSNGPSTEMKPQIFGPLPVELFLNVLDQLVQTPDGDRRQSKVITKTLRSLTLVSHEIYPIATKYLYSAHISLGFYIAISRFRRTLEINRRRHTLTSDEAAQPNRGFAQFDLSRYITSLCISNKEFMDAFRNCGTLPAVVDLCDNVGSTLKTLHLNSEPILRIVEPTEHPGMQYIGRNIFANMLRLEELMISSYITEYFQDSPPNLKRLAVAGDIIHHLDSTLCRFISSPLQTLVLSRTICLNARTLEALFNSYRGRSLDIIFVGFNFSHRTPVDTREWRSDDVVRIWEADVPNCSYGNEDQFLSCDEWMWDQGSAGTLWSQTQRRMKSWAEIQENTSVQWVGA